MSNDSRWKDQDLFYDPEKPGNGNCLQAAVASILGLELRDVPHFNMTGDRSPSTVNKAIHDFMEEKGFYLFMGRENYVPEVLYLAIGPSARGCRHVVIMNDGKLVHDPHFSRAGLESIDYTWMLMPLDPSQNPKKRDTRGLPDFPTTADYLRALKGLGDKAAYHKNKQGKVTQFGWLPSAGSVVTYPVAFKGSEVYVAAIGGEVSQVSDIDFYVDSSSQGAFWIAEKYP